MAFKIGQKIVCVDDTVRPSWRKMLYSHIIRPIKGQIYTVRGVCPISGGIFLVEIVNRPSPILMGSNLIYLEVAYAAQRFRPVDYSVGEIVAEKIEKSFVEQEQPIEI